MSRAHWRWSFDGDPTPRPFPLAPLLEAVGPQAAKRLGMNGSKLRELRERGALTFVEADMLAVRAGLHPSEVWGDLWLSEAS